MLISTEREVHGVSVNQLTESGHLGLVEQLRQLVLVLTQHLIVTMDIEMRNADPVRLHSVKNKTTTVENAALKNISLKSYVRSCSNVSIFMTTS